MPETSRRGDSALLLVSAKLVEAGITLLKPISECLTYDLVIADGSSFKKVQVKRAYPIAIPRATKFKVSLRRVSMTAKGAVARKYSEADTDFIIAAVMESNDIYCLPISVAGDRNSCTLNPFNMTNKFITNKKYLDLEKYKNTLSLNNVIYRL